jgi:hypothetical protein
MFHSLKTTSLYLRLRRSTIAGSARIRKATTTLALTIPNAMGISPMPSKVSAVHFLQLASGQFIMYARMVGWKNQQCGPPGCHLVPSFG